MAAPILLIKYSNKMYPTLLLYGRKIYVVKNNMQPHHKTLFKRGAHYFLGYCFNSLYKQAEQICKYIYL